MLLVFCCRDRDIKPIVEVREDWDIEDIAYIYNNYFKKIKPYYFFEKDCPWLRYYLNGIVSQNEREKKEFLKINSKNIITFDCGKTVFPFNEEDHNYIL